MKKFTLLSAGLAAMIVPLLPATPAQAVGNDKSFVSSTGSGTLCTRAAPCATFQAAHDATAVEGEINCLDSGSFGAATITKSITIDCVGVAASTSGFIANGGLVGIWVTIRNLTITGAFGGGVGVDFVNGIALFVENCVIQHFRAGPEMGIRFAPSPAAEALLVVTDTTIKHNGAGANGGSIIIRPTGSSLIDVVLDRVRAEGNTIGIRVDGSGSTGVLANGALATVLLSNNTIQANAVALSSAAGGALFSYKNNDISNNGTAGSAPTVIAQK